MARYSWDTTLTPEALIALMSEHCYRTQQRKGKEDTVIYLKTYSDCSKFRLHTLKYHRTANYRCLHGKMNRLENGQTRIKLRNGYMKSAQIMTLVVIVPLFMYALLKSHFAFIGVAWLLLGHIVSGAIQDIVYCTGHGAQLVESIVDTYGPVHISPREGVLSYEETPGHHIAPAEHEDS